MTILVLQVDVWDSSLRVGMTGSFFLGREGDLGGKAAQISLSLVRICKPCLYIVPRIATNSQQPTGDKTTLVGHIKKSANYLALIFMFILTFADKTSSCN